MFVFKKISSFYVSVFVFLVLIFFIFFSSVYILFFSDPSASYNIFYSFDEYHGLEDWNLPQHVVADFDNNGVKDCLTFDGYLLLNGENSSVCDRRNEENNQIYDYDGISSFSLIAHSYVIRQGDDWFVVFSKNGYVSYYKLDLNNDSADKVAVPLSLRIDEFVYFAFHFPLIFLFILFI